MSNINLKSLVKESILGDLPSSKIFKYNKKTGKYDAPGTVTEAKYNSTRDADDIFFLWDASIDDGRQGIEHGNASRGGRRYSDFQFNTNARGFDKFKKDVEKLAKKNKWEYDLDNESLYIYESISEPITEAPMDIELQEEINDAIVLLADITKKSKSYSPKAAKIIQSAMKELIQAKKEIRNV